MTPITGTEWAATLAVTGFCLTILPSLPRQTTWARILVVAVGLCLTAPLPGLAAGGDRAAGRSDDAGRRCGSGSSSSSRWPPS